MKNQLRKALAEPLSAALLVGALIKGLIYVIYYRLFTKNVRVNFPFKAFGSVSIRGPGSVYIDKNCSVHENVFRGLNIVTLSEEALVRIGKNSMLGGLSIRCWGQVMIGEGTMTALSLIQDVIYVSCVNDGGPSVANKLVYSKPIIIGDNVWLGGNSIILSGSRIGHDSVLSAGATCFNAEFDKYRLISGNPATRGLPIDQLLKLKART